MNGGVVRRDHPAFACGHDLADREAEGAGVADASERSPLEAAVRRLRDVLQQA
jgi:hypothetical protein